MSTAVRNSIVTIATVLSTIAPVAAVAAPPRDPATSSEIGTVSPYAEPLEALGGRTLAEYLAEYRWADPRLR